MERELTQEAKKVLLLLAQEEAKKFHSGEIQPEHVILPILKMKDGNAVKALEQIGVSVSEMQVEVERSIPRLKGGLLYGEKPPSRRSQEMLVNSQREAGRMGQEYTGAEHLLLGVIQEETCVVSRYLAKCNVTPSVLREVIQRVSTAVNNKDSVWRDVMASFLESEKTRQIAFKASKEWLSQGARKSGMYKGQKRPFCLDLNHAEENLFEMIRTRALTHFEINKIKWHDGHNGKPSNHLCDSQVCCVNFLFPFANKPELLASLLRPMFPTLKSILPLGSGQYVTFEWIGKDNYLGERVRGKGQRTRGANFTSADAAVFFERSDNKRQIVLIEWKYTESYNGTPFQVAPSGTDRRDIYRHVFDAEDCPLKKDLLPSYDSLFFEPFYQFMRQQFLAHKMEAAHELGAEVVSVLHIAPEHNKEFRRVTSPGLRFLDSSATGVWKKLVREPDRFTSVHTEQLFADVLNSPLPELKAWQDYVGQRYCWICEL